jgi:hypothetical protein
VFRAQRENHQELSQSLQQLGLPEGETWEPLLKEYVTTNDSLKEACKPAYLSTLAKALTYSAFTIIETMICCV